MSEKEVADLIEPIEEPMWHYSGGRSSGKSYFEEVLSSKDEEIERLNKELEFERQIKKEAREYIKSIPDDEFVESEHFTELLFILGKVGDNNAKD
jgi:hypothetical protein